MPSTLLRMHRFWIGLVAAMPCAAALSQPLSDPTRPPVDRLPTAAGATSSPANSPPSTGLQLVISSPQRQLVLLDGRLMRQGKAVEGATLLRTHEHQAVVRMDGERLKLNTHPLVKKTVRHSPSRSRP